MTFWPKFYLKMLIPLILLVVVVSFPFVEALLQRRHGEGSSFTSRISYTRTIAYLMFYFVTLYTFIISSVISPFRCIEQSDGSYFLVDNPSEECYTGDWNKNFPIVVVALVFYGLLVPLLLIFIFFLFGRGKGKDSLWFTSHFGLLTRPYRRKLYYWELVNLLRRALFAIATGFWKSGEASYAARLMTTLGFMFFFLWLDVFSSPFTQGTRFVAAT
jgi:hypothetical protein